jgi:CBS domain-containing protein
MDTYMDGLTDEASQLQQVPELSNFEERLFETPLSEVPTRPLLCVAPDAIVDSVIAAMSLKRVSCALVLEGKRLVGIFTERDALDKVATGRVASSLPVAKVMSHDPETLPPSAAVAFALNRMSVEGYRHVPIVGADGTVSAVVGMRDVVAWLVELNPAQVLNVPPAPDSYPRSREGG